MHSILLLLLAVGGARGLYENNVNFRIPAGSRTCFFEKGRRNQTLETQYRVLDGGRGAPHISFDILDPDGEHLVEDYRRSQNSIILELHKDGDYAFCMDNRHSTLGSKLVFVYVLLEDQRAEEPQVTVLGAAGPRTEAQVLEWMGTNEEGEHYYIEISAIADSLTRTLQNMARSRHLLDIAGSLGARDRYRAEGDTFIVDAWSLFQIVFMAVVGAVQVYMIKKLFKGPDDENRRFY